MDDYGDQNMKCHFYILNSVIITIEYAIQNKIQIVEAGAQGEYKLQRGYAPTKHGVLIDKRSRV